jgi:hexokinase
MVVCPSVLFVTYSDVTDDLLTVIGLFSHFYALETTVEERKFFKRLAVAIGTRAARLSACGIAAIVSKKGYLDEGPCGVATDGSLYNVSSVHHQTSNDKGQKAVTSVKRLY